MPQKISISRWNLGEAGTRSIGDYDQELYPTSCRRLRNFVVSETGKLYRRPGLIHHLKIDSAKVPGKLVAFYRASDTWILHFYLSGTHPTQQLLADWYKMIDGVLTLQVNDNTTNLIPGPDGPLLLYTFKAADFNAPRPATVDLNRLSTVQLENDLIICHPNMENVYDARYNPPQIPGDWFRTEDFCESSRSCYYDVKYVDNSGVTPEIEDTWLKKVQNNLNAGGGNAADPNPSPPPQWIPSDPPRDAGWTSYTGEIFSGPNNGKDPDGTPPQTFKYLTSVAFAFQRLVFTRGSFVFGSQGGDPDILGMQLNGDNDDNEYVIDPYQLLASDPFLYQASSDLGFEDFYWLASGSMLLGGANNGCWVLSNAQAGGLDTTNPLMYKSTSHGAYWVPGRIVGDAMLYFQRPGRQLNEFLFSNATQNYETANMNEFAAHLFYDSPPVAMEVQRSPFNVAWIVREDGALCSFTYDRTRGIYAWAQHPFTKVFGDTTQYEGGEAKSICMYSDGMMDYPVVLMKRESAGGEYYALEVMGEYTPPDAQGVFCDSAVDFVGQGPFEITNIQEGSGDGVRILEFSDDLAVGDWIRFIDVQRTDDGAPAVGQGDYIYGAWEIYDKPAAGQYKIRNEIGDPYHGIWELQDPNTALPAENAYISYGSCREVALQPKNPTNYQHLGGLFCVGLADGNPRAFYVKSDGTTFYNPDSMPDDWDGNESSLTADMENKLWVHDLLIGRSYESVFSPFVMKKQVHKAKVTKIELEVFRTLGGKVGTADVREDNSIDTIKLVDLTYPTEYTEYEVYDGTLKPQVVGGYGDDSLWFVLVEEAVPFNIMNVIYQVEAN